MSSTYEIKKAYKVKKDSFLEPISPSKKKAKALKAVEYDPKKVNLPAVKMTGKPSIRAKMSETRRFHAGDLCSPAQRRLASVETFTGTYKTRFDEENQRFSDYAGDYAKNPRQASKLLMNRSYAQLTYADKSADFRTEVTWRMQLRPNIK